MKPSDSVPALAVTGTAKIEQVVERYGDLLFDLCESALGTPNHAQIAFRAILKTVRAESRDNPYVRLERAWVLRVACRELGDLAKGLRVRSTPEEQIRLDSAEKISTRLKSFEHYFQRLRTEDQMVLLLRDKYGLPYPEIAAALGIPQDSLRVRRQQALRALEEWLWES